MPLLAIFIELVTFINDKFISYIKLLLMIVFYKLLAILINLICLSLII